MNVPAPCLDVLVADDSPVYRKLIEQILAEKPYALSFACNGQEALRLFDQTAPSIVITD